MYKVLWVFAGHTGLMVGLVVRWLMCTLRWVYVALIHFQGSISFKIVHPILVRGANFFRIVPLFRRCLTCRKEYRKLWKLSLLLKGWKGKQCRSWLVLIRINSICKGINFGLQCWKSFNMFLCMYVCIHALHCMYVCMYVYTSQKMWKNSF